jgi:hypothetical protein
MVDSCWLNNERFNGLEELKTDNGVSGTGAEGFADEPLRDNPRLGVYFGQPVWVGVHRRQ